MAEQLSLKEKTAGNSSKASDPGIVQGEVAIIEPTRGAVAEVAVPSEATTMLQVIERAALNPNIDVEKMERLLAMHERIVAREAEQRFNTAMVACQSEMKQVSTDADNPQTRSKYATYAKLDSAIRPVYTKHGFSLSFDEGESKPDMVRVVCIVSHTGGHSRTYHRDMPADGKGAKGGDVMTKTHAAGAAGSYGARYLLKGIFNIAIGEYDTDGNQPGDLITEAQQAELVALIDETGANVPKLCAYFKIGSVTEIPARMFGTVKNRLLEKKKAGAKK